MNRRGILVLLALVAVAAGLVVHSRVRLKAKRARARAEMEEIRKAIGIWSTMVRPMPESLDDLQRGRSMTQVDADAIVLGADPWGHDYVIERLGRAVTVTCLGADGAPGGTGADEDIVVPSPPPDDPAPR